MDHGVSFIEQDASADPDAAEALAATGTFATPLLVLGDNRAPGFQVQALAGLLSEGDAP